MTLFELADAVEVKNPPFPIKLTWSHRDWLGGSHIVLQVTSEVRDREYGSLRSVRTEAVYAAKAFEQATEQHMMNWAMNVVKQVFLHEFEECFLWKGARICDPHALAPLPTSFPPQRL